MPRAPWPIAAAVRCAPPANRPSRQEFARCQPYLESEIRLLRNLSVVVVLGQVVMDRFLRAWQAAGHTVPKPKPSFGHGRTSALGSVTLLASYHPSQRNTQTGLLTEEMFDAVFHQARIILDADPVGGARGTPTKRRR